MIANGLAEGTIAVTPTSCDVVPNIDEGNAGTVLARLYGQEVIHYPLPAVISTYPTCAVSASGEDIIAKRNHLPLPAFPGEAPQRSIPGDYLPYSAYYGNYSSPSNDIDAPAEAVAAEEYESCDIKYLYASAGELDSSRISDLEARTMRSFPPVRPPRTTVSARWRTTPDMPTTAGRRASATTC